MPTPPIFGWKGERNPACCYCLTNHWRLQISTLYKTMCVCVCRSKESVTVTPADVVLLEGILVLYDHSIRDLLHMKLFVDTDSDIRLARRGRVTSSQHMSQHMLQHMSQHMPLHMSQHMSQHMPLHMSQHMSAHVTAHVSTSHYTCHSTCQHMSQHMLQHMS